MQNRIRQLINDSIRDQMYPKAIECLQALRAGAAKEGEWEKFNAFLRELRAAHENRRRDDFWQLVVASKITLISGGDDECAGCTISPEDAKQVWVYLGQLRQDR
jgi:ATP-dependent DNA helicase 2 subunit 2